jgi:bifunctional DNA-binding transcriptional regulator/antitoxin component of YhaV-PrlF toxin-antitoxin module
MITTMTGKNQLTFPARLAKQLGLQPGTRIFWELGADGTILLRPLPTRAQLAKTAQGLGKAWLQPGDSQVADLLTERAADDTREP